MNALQEIYNNLQDGKQYGYYYAMRFPGFHTVLYVDKFKKYIHWCNFGESANKNTLKELKWILEVIFHISPENFLEKFEVYDSKKFEEWEAIANSQNTEEYRKWRN